jgi:hypothetical protein
MSDENTTSTWAILRSARFQNGEDLSSAGLATSSGWKLGKSEPTGCGLPSSCRLEVAARTEHVEQASAELRRVELRECGAVAAGQFFNWHETALAPPDRTRLRRSSFRAPKQRAAVEKIQGAPGKENSSLTETRPGPRHSAGAGAAGPSPPRSKTNLGRCSHRERIQPARARCHEHTMEAG